MTKAGWYARFGPKAKKKRADARHMARNPSPKSPLSYAETEAMAFRGEAVPLEAVQKPKSNAPRSSPEKSKETWKVNKVKWQKTEERYVDRNGKPTTRIVNKPITWVDPKAPLSNRAKKKIRKAAEKANITKL